MTVVHFRVSGQRGQDLIQRLVHFFRSSLEESTTAADEAVEDSQQLHISSMNAAQRITVVSGQYCEMLNINIQLTR